MLWPSEHQLQKNFINNVNLLKMRKLIFLLPYLFFCTGIFAQSFSITCLSSTPSCLNPMPNVDQSYQLNFNNLPASAVRLEGDFVAPSPMGTMAFSKVVSSQNGSVFIRTINWPNISNPVISITNGKIFNGSNAIIGTFSVASTDINVKYIGSSGSFSVSGGTLLNSTTAEIDCGVKNITVTLGAPPTSDPINAPITYTWSYTGGYSGPSTTSSPSANITSPATGNGSVTVSAKRNDVTTYSNPSKTIQITRKVIQFSNLNINSVSSNHGYGNNALCVGETGTLQGTISGFTGANINWTSSTLSFVGATNLANISYTGSNAIHQLTLTASTGCSSASRTTEIKVGKPIITQKLVNGVNGSGYANVSLNPVDVRVVSPAAPTSSTFAFDCPGACGSSSLTYLGNICTAYLYPFGRIRADMTNRCGTSDPTYFYITNTSYSGFRVSSPNPTSGPIAIEILDYEIKKDKIQNIQLDSDYQRNIRSFLKSDNANLSKNGNGIIEWDISDLPKGTYYITMTSNEKTETQKIIKF